MSQVKVGFPSKASLPTLEKNRNLAPAGAYAVGSREKAEVEAPCGGQRMADLLQERTAQLLTDYLEYCAREPGTPEPPPSTPEAAVLRSAAARLQQQYEPFFSLYRGYPGNRVELVAQMAEAVLSDNQALNWGRVMMLVTFAGTLLERKPQDTHELHTWDQAALDSQRLVDLLCAQLVGQHRAWLEAQGGWDGFCDFFRTPLPLTFWRNLLVQIFMSCLLATIFIYFCTRFYRFYRTS
ncbi:BCL2 like 10 [Ictidomys tridecemlineatus]|uniref:bcl-2-like protein 10 n=1 Tax=Ictidomys tridecemlineatus TaxID=43179 RepID=UPI000B548D88|nr:bcl-2-like protein 10 [Ictidomys tridecemlineatus]KAG3261886.1 BCL2 like 10 [Ictidomys tridecemlineatus]